MAPKKDKYKVIIIGGGPAGISTALHLLNCGISDILIVERFKFPRYKCCAGYVTNKTSGEYKKLGLDIKDCHYSLIRDFNIVSKLKRRLTIQNKFLYTNDKIDRVELDNAFFSLAKEKGIETCENTSVKSHSMQENRLVLSDGTVLSYDNIVFADGTSGFGSRYQKHKAKNIALQITFHSDMPEAIDIHFGITKNGYGWVSTYGGMTNVGLTDLYKKGVNYKKVFGDFLNSLGIYADLSNLRAAFTPIGVKTPVMGNVYFVGDAVGACDPFTLSGVGYALKSGEFCAKAISENNAKIYKKFISKLNRRFSLMKALSKIFYTKTVQFLVFSIGCKLFGKLISSIFNNFFVTKK